VRGCHQAAGGIVTMQGLEDVVQEDSMIGLKPKQIPRDECCW